ncbi:MAG TPA: peptidoglycan-binding domain-containing protein [Myxococcales bacterium]|nr:peptidoglycan-binding domain-containing protein [Myxococcales bacterium]
MADTPPDTTTGNPFSLIAYVLFKVRHSLEDIEEAGRAPRWIRIARARQAQGSSDFIGQGVRAAINGFAEALSYLVELTLDIQEVLVQTDAAKALVEVSADFIKAATDDTFVNGVRAIVGEQPGDNPLSGVGPVLDSIKRYLGYIPDPDDVKVLGHELYRLLCIEQEALPRAATSCLVDEGAITVTSSHHISVDKSGKIRLLQWAFNEDLTTFGLGDKAHPEDEKLALKRFGTRRLWRTDGAKLPARSAEKFGASSDADTIFEFFYDTREPDAATRTLDLTEAYTLLEKMGFTEPAAANKNVFGLELTKRLRRFQAVNGLPLSGELDNPTINRLMHLDHTAKNIRRARPFSADQLPEGIDQLDAAGAPACPGGFFTLINPGADDPGAESIPVATKPGFPKYPYYVAGTLLPATGPAPVPSGGGWISDLGTGVTQGFVALRSRIRTDDESHFEGGILSEGEAAHGSFFFAARFTEPWIAGRNGTPKADALFSPAGAPPVPAGAVSRLYQWVPLDWINRPAGWDLYVTASVLRRSLFEERSRTTGAPDQGTLGIEFYDDGYFKGNKGTRRDPTKALAPAKFAPVFPDQAARAAMMTASEVARKRTWAVQEVPDVQVPQGAVALVVILEGRYQAGWDIDAYFDDVKVSWSFKKKAA